MLQLAWAKATNKVPITHWFEEVLEPILFIIILMSTGKSPQQIIRGSGHENIMIYCYVSAALVSVQQLVFDHTQGARYGVSPTTEKTSLQLVSSSIFLVVDRQKSHYEQQQLLPLHDIHSIRFPSHLLHSLQSLDIGVFKP